MTRPLSRHNPLRAHARAAWMAAFEEALVERIPSVRGRVDWDTATYLYGQGLRVVDAVDSYERSYTADLADARAPARTASASKEHQTMTTPLIAAEANANGNLTLNALKALVAERDDLRRLLDEARAEREAMANVLPGVYYIDPPDGGDVSLLKPLQRMSNDAARYRLLRRKFAIISDGEGNAEFCPINLPRPTYIAPNTAIELDTALDRERLGLDGAKRPPTPVGWSDTDWIKHLQE